MKYHSGKYGLDNLDQTNIHSYNSVLFIRYIIIEIIVALRNRMYFLNLRKENIFEDIEILT